MQIRTPYWDGQRVSYKGGSRGGEYLLDVLDDQTKVGSNCQLGSVRVF
jgi:hypothetical protein